MKKVVLPATLLSIAAVCAGLALNQTAAQPQAKKPNVLFIVADDLSTSLSVYGEAIAKSPNLDRLAKRGVKFDRAYCQYPLCSPSRTSFLSGRRPETTRIFENNSDPRANLKDAVMLPEHFKQQGYFTARVGKIAHDTHERIIAWDVAENATPSPYFMPDEDASEIADNTKAGIKERITVGNRTGATRDEVMKLNKPTDEWGLALAWRATSTRDEEEPDGVTARRVAKLIEANKDRPFFIAAGFHKPHLPWVAPKKYFDAHPRAKMRWPNAPANDRDDIPRPALNIHSYDDGLNEAQRRQAIAAYHASAALMDAQVGVLLDTLDRLKLSDNTIIVFIGDHGFHLGEHGGLWRKLTSFEECARAPLIVVAPKKRTGAVSQRLVEFVDIYPTLAELCGLPAPAGVEGLSFAPLLDNPNQPWKKAAFTTLARRNLMGRSVRTERYRYTEWGDEKTAELYDHQTDPREYTNLISDPRHASTLAEMRKTLKDGWRAAVPASSRVAAKEGEPWQAGALEVIRTPEARFANLPGYNFRPRYVEVQGLRMHYVDEGPRNAPPVLLLHGEPSWSYLYRKMIPILTAAGYRAIAPDFIGFGRSDKLVSREAYTYKLHVDALASFLRQLNLRDVTLVCQDWGGLVGLRVAAENPDRFARIVAANTGLPTGDTPPGEAFMRWQQFSQTVKDFNIGEMLKRASRTEMSPEIVAAYNAPFPDDRYKAGARQFPMLVPTKPDDPAAAANRKAWEVLRRWEKPFLTAFSDGDAITRGGDIVFQNSVPGAKGQPHVTIKGAGHFLQEDKGEELAKVVVDFIARTRSRQPSRASRP